MRRLPLAMAALSAALLAGAPATHAAKSPWYTYKKGTNCGAQVDPVNVVFYGRDATAGRTAGFVARYMRWGDASSSGTQGFITPSCQLATQQRADGPDDATRNHVRLRQRERRPGQRRFTVGDAHHEDHVGGPTNPFTGCGPTGGHAVDKGSVGDRTPEGSGFDQGRREMAGAFRVAGRRVTYRNKRNTRAFKQCDGDDAGSDGYVAYITIPDKR